MQPAAGRMRNARHRCNRNADRLSPSLGGCETPYFEALERGQPQPAARFFLAGAFFFRVVFFAGSAADSFHAPSA